MIDMDMKPHVIHPIGCEQDKNSKNYIAVKYGPLVLARDARLNCDIGEKVSLDYNGADKIRLKKCNTADFSVLVNLKCR